MSRTFSREHWNEAQDAWQDGRFSDEWKSYRHQAAFRGMIYPPEGSREDSWDDEEPSQRAMLVRAIRETPQLLETAIAHSHTWGDVIEYVLKRRDEWRDELDVRDRELARRKAEIEPRRRSEMLSIKSILTRISDS